MNPFQHAASARHFARKIAQGSHLIASRFAVRQGPSPEPSNRAAELFARCAQVLPRLAHSSPARRRAPLHSTRSERRGFFPASCSTATCRKNLHTSGKSFRVAALRMPSFSKSTRRGQKSSICEELVMGNLTSRNLTWANAELRRGRRPYRPLQTHISTISVHESDFLRKRAVGASK